MLRGQNDTTGVALLEAYDLEQTAVTSKLRNIATRGFVGIDDNAIIGGFIVSGTGTSSPRVVARALGPTLTQFGVSGAVGDPSLELHSGNGDLIAFKDNWRDSQPAEITATGLQPPDDREAAIVRDVAPATTPRSCAARARPPASASSKFIRSLTKSVGGVWPAPCESFGAARSGLAFRGS